MHNNLPIKQMFKPRWTRQPDQKAILLLPAATALALSFAPAVNYSQIRGPLWSRAFLWCCCSWTFFSISFHNTGHEALVLIQVKHMYNF